MLVRVLLIFDVVCHSACTCFNVCLWIAFKHVMNTITIQQLLATITSHRQKTRMWGQRLRGGAKIRNKINNFTLLYANSRKDRAKHLSFLALSHFKSFTLRAFLTAA